MAGEKKRLRDKIPFFGAAPWERLRLRRTRDKRPVKTDELDLNAVGRRKGAPEKVGEEIRLIDIALGEAPAGPSRDVLARKAGAEARAKAELERESREQEEAERAARIAAGPPPPAPELTLAVRTPLRRRLERLCGALGALSFLLGALPLWLPEQAAPLVPWRTWLWGAAGGLLWLSLVLRQLLAFRERWRALELVRATILAAGPAGAGAGLVLWLAGALPSLGAPPGVLAGPFRARVLAPLEAALPQAPPQLVLAGAWAALVFLAAWGYRSRRPGSLPG